MQKEMKERLEACLIFYRDKARIAENSEKRVYHEAYAAGINRALTGIVKFERQEEDRKNEREIL